MYSHYHYRDNDEADIVRLLSNRELQTAFEHLGDQETWKLQVLV